jgi:hypothetical protein
VQDGRDVRLINLGIPAAETDLIRQVELPIAMLATPELLTLFTGANDIVARDDVNQLQRDLSHILSAL